LKKEKERERKQRRYGARDYGEIEARFPDFKSYAAPYK